MYIDTVPNRNSKSTFRLRESFRENGKACKRTIANITHWPKRLANDLRILLKGGTAIDSLSNGHVAATLSTLRQLRLDASLTTNPAHNANARWQSLSPASSTPAPNSPPPTAWPPTPCVICWPANAASTSWIKTVLTPPRTDCWHTKTTFSENCPNAICKTVHWCSMTRPKYIWKDANAHSPNTAIAKMANRKLSSACYAMTRLPDCSGGV